MVAVKGFQEISEDELMDIGGFGGVIEVEGYHKLNKLTISSNGTVTYTQPVLSNSLGEVGFKVKIDLKPFAAALDKSIIAPNRNQSTWNLSRLGRLGDGS